MIRGEVVLVLLFGAWVPAAAENTPVAKPPAARAQADAACRAAFARILEHHDLVGAEQLFRDALAANPVAAANGLALIATAREDWGGAVERLHEAAQLEPDPARRASIEKRAAALAKLAAAESTPEAKATRRYSDCIGRARAFLRGGALRQAFEEAGIAAKLDDSRFEAYAVAASVLERSGDSTRMIAFLNEAARRAPSALATRIRALVESTTSSARSLASARENVSLGRFEAAAFDYTSAASREQDRDGRHRLDAADCLLLAGRPDDAERLARTMLASQDPEERSRAMNVLSQVETERSAAEHARTVRAAAQDLLDRGVGLHARDIPEELRTKLRELIKKRTRVTSIAIGPDSDWVVTLGAAGYVASGGAAQDLKAALDVQVRAGNPIDFVTIASDRNWAFVFSGNGYTYSRAVPGLVEALKEKNAAGARFGPLVLTDGGFVLVFDRYGYVSSGQPESVLKGLKFGFDDCQRVNSEKSAFNGLAIGSRGECVAVFGGGNGSYRIGLSDELARLFVKLHSDGSTIDVVALGPGSGYVVLADQG